MTENITFEDQKNQGYNRFRDAYKIPFFQKILIKAGLAKNEAQANRVLVVFAGIILFVCLILVIWSYQPSTIKTINIKS